jgi:lysophospholipase L1-like esterase
MYKNKFLKFRHLCSLTLASCILLSTGILSGQSKVEPEKKWVGTWATAPQLVEPGNMPPSPGLNNNSLRQVLCVSIPGDTLRLKVSNMASTTPVTLKAVKFALSAGGMNIYDSTTVKLTFNGSPEVTMDSSGSVVSDPFAFNLEERMAIAITIYYGETSATLTGHPGSRTTSFLRAGNDTSVTDFTGAVTTDHWYNISGIDVLAPSTASCIAVLGNSITDGRGTTTNQQNRWTDNLSVRLLANPGTEQVGVLNLGLGGNCVLKYCLGPAAVDRYQCDILDQAGVRAAIIFEGVNDIGGGVSSNTSATTIANDLIAAYKTMIDSAHSRNIVIYGATITPFKGNGYYNKYSEACRTKVNDWIRNSGRFDAVIDFDRYMRNPLDTIALVSSYQNDGLHPDAAGYVKMADSIDLNLFLGLDTLVPAPDTSQITKLCIEPECYFVGENWKLVIDPAVSNQGYAQVKEGYNSPSEAPSDPASAIYIPFSINRDTSFAVFARVNCEDTAEDSYWVKMDEGDFVLNEGLVTAGWEWKTLGYYQLAAGEHSLTIALSEEGAAIDKLCIINDTVAPPGVGNTSDFLCLPDTTTPVIVDALNDVELPSTYSLSQNYPNPFTGYTTIAFEITNDEYVSLKVFSILGKEIAELAGKKYTAGAHTVEFVATDLSGGIYFYTLKTDLYSAGLKMIIQT